MGDDKAGFCGINLPAKKYRNRHQADLQVYAEIFTKLIQTESGFNPNAKSPVGAIGLGQFMPGTLQGALDSYNAEQKAKGQKVYSLNDYATNPRLQIILSARHFNGLLARYKGDYAKALAAYNAGGGAVDSGKAAQYKETVNYVGKIMGISPKMAKEAILSPTPMYVHSKLSAREAEKEKWNAGNKVYQGIRNWVTGMFPALKPGMDLME